eukprot:2603968-Amphidinium_carterae.2
MQHHYGLKFPKDVCIINTDLTHLSEQWSETLQHRESAVTHYELHEVTLQRIEELIAQEKEPIPRRTSITASKHVRQTQFPNPVATTTPQNTQDVRQDLRE